MNLLQQPQVLAIRRNHALEHATVHLLSRDNPQIHILGHSNPDGFILIGNVSSQAIQKAVDEALARLRSGQKHLAIHPGCGTNLVITILGMGAAAWLAMRGTKTDRERWQRLPFTGLMVMLAQQALAPLGPRLQETVTTEANLGDLQIKSISILRNQPPFIYFIRTR